MTSHEAGTASGKEAATKKELILAAARDLAKPRFTPAEIEQIRRQLIAHLGERGKTSPDYIVSVLEEAGLRVICVHALRYRREDTRRNLPISSIFPISKTRKCP